MHWQSIVLEFLKIVHKRPNLICLEYEVTLRLFSSQVVIQIWQFNDMDVCNLLILYCNAPDKTVRSQTV